MLKHQPASSASRSSSTKTPEKAAPETPSAGGDFTFGVEFEFMLVSLRNRPDRYHYPIYGSGPSEFAKTLIRDALSQPLEARCRSCGIWVPFQLPLINSPYAPREWENQFDLWEVVTETMLPRQEEVSSVDYSVRGRAYDYDWYGVEIKSRILHPQRCFSVQSTVGEHVHEFPYGEEVKAVLAKLQQRFTRFGGTEPQYDYLYPTDEAGLHVHVGNGLEGLNIETIKKVLCMSVAFERQIDSVQAVHRIGGTDVGIRPLEYPNHHHPFPSNYTKIDPYVYNVGLADGFLYNCYSRRQRAEGIDIPSMHGIPDYPACAYDNPYVHKASKGFDFEAFVILISHAPNIESLLGMYTSYLKNTIINIRHSNPRMNPYETKKTIELRQHRSCLQPEAVIAWIKFVVTMVGFCESNSMAGLLALITRDGRMRQPSFDFSTLCQQIGCDPATVKHYKDQLSGEYSLILRHTEQVYACLGRSEHDPLAALALYSIRKERKDIIPMHVAQRIRAKFLMGGYGQFSRQYIDEFLGPADVSEEARQKITLGYRAPVHATEHVTPRLSLYDSGPNDLAATESHERERVPQTTAPRASDAEEPRGRNATVTERRYGTPPPGALPSLSELGLMPRTSSLMSQETGIALRQHSPSTALSTPSTPRTIPPNESRERSKSRSRRGR